MPHRGVPILACRAGLTDRRKGCGRLPAATQPKASAVSSFRQKVTSGSFVTPA